MPVRVRYRPHDLGEAGVVEVIEEADSFRIHDDNTAELRRFVRREGGKNYYQVVGEIHPERWESIVVVEDEEDEG